MFLMQVGTLDRLLLIPLCDCCCCCLNTLCHFQTLFSTTMKVVADDCDESGDEGKY